MQWHKLSLLKRWCRSSANKLYAAKQVCLTSWSCSLEPGRLQYGSFDRTVTAGGIHITVCVQTSTQQDYYTYAVAFIWRQIIRVWNVHIYHMSCSVELCVWTYLWLATHEGVEGNIRESSFGTGLDWSWQAPHYLKCHCYKYPYRHTGAYAHTIGGYIVKLKAHIKTRRVWVLSFASGLRMLRNWVTWRGELHVPYEVEKGTE